MKGIIKCGAAAFLLILAWGCGCNETKKNLPQAPANLSATPGNGSVTLTWQASAGATGYNVYRGSPDCTSLTKVASTTGTSIQITGLTNGTQYCFVVKAYNTDGESGPSNQATATPTAPTPPSPPQSPTALTAISGNTIVTLTWQASPGATGYNVYMGSPDCSSLFLTSTTIGTSVQVTGLINGIQYCFVVRAYNSGGESGPSNQATATPTASAPSAPSLQGATPSTTSVTLTWTSVSGATGYRVYMGTTSGSYSFFTATTATNFTVTDLSSGTTYYFVVTATNASGESAYSNELFATTFPSGACGSLSTDFILITSASPVAGTALTTNTPYTFQTTACYTLTDTSGGYVAAALFSNGTIIFPSSPALATFSQPVAPGSNSVNLTLGPASLPLGSTWASVDLTLSDSTGAMRGFDPVTYPVDNADYFRVVGVEPMEGSLIVPGSQTFTLTIAYNHATIVSEDLLVISLDQNFNFIDFSFPTLSGIGSGTAGVTITPGIPSCGVTTLYILIYSLVTGVQDFVSFPVIFSPCLPPPNIFLAGYSITDPAPGGNDNGVVEPGETVALQVTLTNIGADAFTVTGTLYTFVPDVTIMPPNPASFGNIPSGGSSSSSYTVIFAPSVPLGNVFFNLFVTANSGSYSTTLFFSITVVFIPPPAECTMFLDNIEAGINGFTTTGFWHQVQDGVDACANSRSPTHSWWYGQEITTCTFDNGLTNWGLLTSPNINTCSPTATTATLSFWSWEQTECFGSCPWDVRRVYLSVNGGTTWSQVWESGSSTSSSWYQVWVPLIGISPGTPIKLRFYFDTIDSVANNYQGWYVDDIQVTQP